MSTSLSRRRTKGAFGNQKPRTIEREFAPKQAPAAPGVREPTFADKLAEFSQPILQQAGNNRTAAKGAMNVAILIWNATIEGEAKIAEAKKKLEALPGSTPEQVEELVTTMVERKKELYPNENLLVTNFVLKFNNRTGSPTFRVSAVNLNPEGVTKGNLQDIINPSL